MTQCTLFFSYLLTGLKSCFCSSSLLLLHLHLSVSHSWELLSTCESQVLLSSCVSAHFSLYLNSWDPTDSQKIHKNRPTERFHNTYGPTPCLYFWETLPGREGEDPWDHRGRRKESEVELGRHWVRVCESWEYWTRDGADLSEAEKGGQRGGHSASGKGLKRLDRYSKSQKTIFHWLLCVHRQQRCAVN